jgi:hypothetical protein
MLLELRRPRGRVVRCAPGLIEGSRFAVVQRMPNVYSGHRAGEKTLTHEGAVDISGRRDFSRFDPSAGEAPL